MNKNFFDIHRVPLVGSVDTKYATVKTALDAKKQQVNNKDFKYLTFTEYLGSLMYNSEGKIL